MTKEVNIKDYIEVNSAISLALQGLQMGIQGINFKQQQLGESFLKLNLNLTSGDKKNKANKKSNNNFELNDLVDKFSIKEMSLIRTSISLLIFIIIYSGFSILLVKQIEKKEDEADSVITKINAQISRVTKDTKTLNETTTKYSTLITDLQDINEKISEINKSKNLIPNLLNQIMNVIDSTVQITSIENTTDKHIVIKAQSTKYPGLGYFKTKLQTQNILTNVISGSGTKQNDIISVTIEGDLP